MSKLRELSGKANRLQQSRIFKIVATCVVALAAIGGIVAYAMTVSGAGSELSYTDAPPTEGLDPVAAKLQADVARKTVEVVNGILSAKQDPTSAAVGILILAGLCIGVIWLGLGLTYLGLGLATSCLVLLLYAFRIGDAAAPLVIGIASLTASFTVLMKLTRVLLGASNPIFAVARNVLDEAVRMKISLIFIVLIIFGLAALPGLLDDKAFLRYRVQSFLQYGTGGSFWLIAVLVLLFSASSVTFEQRDKIIWQTMTKPVAAWQYILGKWLGVVSLAAVLLIVSASGIFLFTEYLRNQPATGESSAYVVREASEGLSQDRFILETSVLAARETKLPDPANLDQEQLNKNVEDRIQQEIKKLEASGERDAMLTYNREEIRAKLLEDLPKGIQASYRSLPRNESREYTFSGLGAVRNSTSPVMLRMKINSSSGMPDKLFRMSIWVQGEGEPRVIEMPLNQFISLQPPILPTCVNQEGRLSVMIANGDVAQPQRVNEEDVWFPPEGLELSYSVGGYRANFFRCIAVLWVKLAFLAMLAICVSTFLSFPVACLVAFTTFVSAEGASFVKNSLEYYATEDREGKTLVVNTLISWVADAISSTFRLYADLRPTDRLVEGLRLSWSQVAVGTVVLLFATVGLYIVASLIFRRRELATYSGN